MVILNTKALLFVDFFHYQSLVTIFLTDLNFLFLLEIQDGLAV